MDDKNDRSRRPQPGRNKRLERILLWATLVSAVVFLLALFGGGTGVAPVPLTRFQQLAREGALKSATVDDTTHTVVARLSPTWDPGSAAGASTTSSVPATTAAGSKQASTTTAPATTTTSTTTSTTSKTDPEAGATGTTQAKGIAQSSLGDAGPGSVGWGAPDSELVRIGSVSTKFPAEYSDQLLALLQRNKVTVEVVAGGGIHLESLVSLLLLALLAGAAVSMVRRGGAAGVAGMGSRRTTTPAEVPETRFSDVIGCDEAVAELREVATFLDTPERYAKVGARVPRGFLLVGPPGTGKTLLARACAGEAGVPFFAISASDFVELYVGMGASRVRKLFEQAAKHPRAIVFIDELDSVGKSRNAAGLRSGSNDEQESTLNALLVEMDGFARSNIVVLAATNRPDVLDPALLRAGRFDRQVHVPAPDRLGRQQLFDHYLEGKPVAEGVDTSFWARRTVGMSGADIEAVCNDAALETVRRGQDVIDDGCLDVAVSTAFMGRERRSALVSDADREVTAWHEAGHTVVALVHEGTADPVSVSIVPRGPAGGVTWLGEHDQVLSTRSQLVAQLAVTLGGRAGELVRFGELTQGASDDIRRATELATAMVSQWGMGSMGPVRVDASFDGTMPREVLDEVAGILHDAEAEAVALLERHRELFDAVAAGLLERETLDAGELTELRAQVGDHTGEGAVAVPDVGEPYRAPGANLVFGAADAAPEQGAGDASLDYGVVHDAGASSDQGSGSSSDQSSDSSSDASSDASVR